MDTEGEQSLVQRSLDGDQRAFGELVDVYQRVLYNVALRMCNDREDARDVTQTAFLKAWRHLGSYDRRQRFFSWLYRIVVNESLNLLRRRRAEVPLEERMVSGERPPEDQVEAREVREIVQKGLMALSTDYRQVIILISIVRAPDRSHADSLPTGCMMGFISRPTPEPRPGLCASPET